MLQEHCVKVIQLFIDGVLVSKNSYTLQYQPFTRTSEENEFNIGDKRYCCMNESVIFMTGF
jgi:hypothetical protein